MFTLPKLQTFLYFCPFKSNFYFFTMKKSLFLTAVLSALTAAAQQSFSGINTSQYGGMYKVANNPASFVDGINRFGLNIISVDASFGNNKIGLGTDLTKSFNDFTSNVTSHNDINASLNLDVFGPSFYFHVGRRNAFAFTSRARVLTNVHDVDAKVIQSFLSGTNDLNLASSYALDINKQSVTANAFSEFAFSWGRVLSKDEHKVFKVGITAKIVRGAISTYAGFTEINGNISGNITENNGDAYLNINVDAGEKAEFVLSNGGINISQDPSVSDILRSQATGLGFDLGFVYEYRKEGCPSCTFTPYDLKIGASFTDIGRLKYTATDQSYKYTLNSGSHSINLSDIQKSMTDGVLITETSLQGASITSSLPTALRLNADVRITGPLFVDVAAGINLVNVNKEYNAYYANSLVITPRAEWKYFGAYLPLSTTRHAGTNVGAALRLGPLFVGSRSIISNLLSKNAKELNVFCGLQFEI